MAKEMKESADIVLSGLLLAAIVYGALVLKARPANASTCDCQTLEWQAVQFCYENFGTQAIVGYCVQEESQLLLEYQCNGDPYWGSRYAYCDL